MGHSEIIHIEPLPGTSFLAKLYHWIRHHMPDFKNGIETVGAALTIFGLICATLLRFNRKVIIPFKNWISQAEETNRIVKEQLTANCGSSMRDAISRIERMAQAHHASIHGWMTLNVTYAVFETDIHGACEWVNPVYQIWTGRPLDELRGDGWLGVIYPPDRKIVEEAWCKAVDQQRNFHGTYRFQDYDGKPFWANCSAIVTRFRGEPFGYLGRVERCESPADGQPFL